MSEAERARLRSLAADMELMHPDGDGAVELVQRTFDALDAAEAGSAYWEANEAEWDARCKRVRAERDTARADVARMVEENNETRRAFGERAAAEHERAVAAERERDATEQARKRAALGAAVAVEALGKAEAERDAARAEVARLREALEWYEDGMNYERLRAGRKVYRPVMEDRGARARAALAATAKDGE
ncbi:MAG: hypothetical protein KGO96_13935 [Elusimicrobia bacterium]|nr:hypothetical protein [Elusimicrobiota bacterium]MDE2426994.1 hypothetical protein [Elusimicrobiota bacterium]